MHSSAQAPKSQLAIGQPSTGGRWNPPKKDTPRPKTGSHNEMVGGAQ